MGFSSVVSRTSTTSREGLGCGVRRRRTSNELDVLHGHERGARANFTFFPRVTSVVGDGATATCTHP